LKDLFLHPTRAFRKKMRTFIKTWFHICKLISHQSSRAMLKPEHLVFFSFQTPR
jgi:hypothetical protein